MKKDTIITVALIIVPVILSIILGVILLGNWTMMKREYNFNAYKVTKTEDSITLSLYPSTGEHLRTDETLYLNNGKTVKRVEKFYCKTINAAKLNEEIEKENQGLMYSISRDKNVLIHTYLNRDGNINSFNTNADAISYIEKNIAEQYKNYKKIE